MTAADWWLIALVVAFIVIMTIVVLGAQAREQRRDERAKQQRAEVDSRLAEGDDVVIKNGLGRRVYPLELEHAPDFSAVPDDADLRIQVGGQPFSAELVDGNFVLPDGVKVVADPFDGALVVTQPDPDPSVLAEEIAAEIDVQAVPVEGAKMATASRTRTRRPAAKKPAKQTARKTTTKKRRLRVTVYEAKDGWRWRLIPATGGNTIDASSEAFTRRAAACVNAARSTGCPAKVGEWEARTTRDGDAVLVAFIER